MTPTPDPNFTGDEARPAKSASISSSWVCGVRSVIGLKDNLSAKIMIGDTFNFSFRNLDVVHTVKFKKRTSRSQRKQNQKQEIKFEKERMELYNNADEFKVTESQTDESETIEFGINIDEVKVENIEDVLNEDSNGTIHTSHDKV